MIELILLERVEKLGQMGQLVKVKPGYARNYLLPQKKAMRATKENLTYFETQRAQLEANNLQRRTEATEIGGKLEGLTVVIICQAGESGQLYGSVSASGSASSSFFTRERSQVRNPPRPSSPAQYPAGSGLDASVLLRQPTASRTSLRSRHGYDQNSSQA